MAQQCQCASYTTSTRSWELMNDCDSHDPRSSYNAAFVLPQCTPGSSHLDCWQDRSLDRRNLDSCCTNFAISSGIFPICSGYRPYRTSTPLGLDTGEIRESPAWSIARVGHGAVACILQPHPRTPSMARSASFSGGRDTWCRERRAQSWRC